MSTIWIFAIFARLGFAWYASATGAEIDERRDQATKLQKQLTSSQADLQKVTNSVAAAQRDPVQLKPKYSAGEYEGPDFPELSAEEREELERKSREGIGVLRSAMVKRTQVCLNGVFRFFSSRKTLDERHAHASLKCIGVFLKGSNFSTRYLPGTVLACITAQRLIPPA